jgi:glycosyltransferase involved in cell wall biosynthesis
MVSTRFAVPRFQEVLKGFIDHVHYCPFFLPYLNPIDDRTLNSKSKSDNVRLLFVGRDGARKGVATLLKALDSLSVATARKLEVDVVTETQLDARPKNLSAFRHHARLANDKTVELMRDAHVFCLPTLSDVYGVVFVEALSQGCAVIADNDLTRLEIVQENKAGFCVDPTDREQLANAMEQLVSDRAQLVRCMNSAKLAFDQHFAADVTARRHEKIFREMIKTGRRND